MTMTQEIPPAEVNTPSNILDRMTLVLDAFDGHESLGLTEIVNRTGLPSSSAHRMLDRLVRLRWLHREGRSYSLGIRLVELGSLAVHQDRVHAAAREHLHHLYRATGMVVHLAVLDGDDVVYLDKIGGRLAPQVPTRIGGRLPAARTALGKALLAYRDHDEPGGELIRELGYAVERSGTPSGFGCIAAPIGEVGEANTAVSICGPRTHMSFDSRLTTPVQLTAAAIVRSLNIGRFVTPTLQRRNILRALPTAPSVLAEG
ncbi:IclR family transcriptional regulator [Nocardia sp. NPDC004711]